jgi:hypothetical protein
VPEHFASQSSPSQFCASAASAHAFDCAEKYCKATSSCAEAHYHLTVCGEWARDGDGDGIPCENVCGKTLDEYRRLRGPDPPPKPPQPPVTQ